MPQHPLLALCHAGRLAVGSPDRGRAWEGCASTRSPSQKPLALAVVEKVFRKPCIEQGLPIAAIPECKEQAFVDKNMDFELGDGMRKGEDTAPPAWTDACPCTAWAGEARAPAAASCGRLARSRRSAPCQLPPVAPRQAPAAERQGRQKRCVFNLSPTVFSPCRFTGHHGSTILLQAHIELRDALPACTRLPLPPPWLLLRRPASPPMPANRERKGD